MIRSHANTVRSIVLLQFVGTVCTSMIVSFMAFFIVEGLGQTPWMISLYSGAVSLQGILINRQFSRSIDRGKGALPLIGFAVAGYLLATLALSIAPTIWILMTVGVIGFGVSASAVSTMFTLGAIIAEQYEIGRDRINAVMRAAMSSAWMVGPAVAFLVASYFDKPNVFKVCACLGFVWLSLWWWVTLQAIEPDRRNIAVEDRNQGGGTKGLWLASVFVFLMSSSHALTFSALPLFYVREVGLPGFAPGIAFTVKTFVEVLAVFATPYLIARYGIQKPLIATAFMAVGAIQLLASVQTLPQMLVGAGMEGLYYGLYAGLGISFVQSFAKGRPAYASAIYWNTLMISGFLAGPAVGAIAQLRDFRTVIQFASLVALGAALLLLLGARYSKV